MATKFLNRYGTGLNEINYDNTQYSPTNHTHSNYYAKTGGDISGTIKFPSSMTNRWLDAPKYGNGCISINSPGFYSVINGNTLNGRFCIAAYPGDAQYGNDIINIAWSSNTYLSGTTNGAEAIWEFDGKTKSFNCPGNISTNGDITIQGRSLKAVIDFMDKYNSMLNIIGNNA